MRGLGTLVNAGAVLLGGGLGLLLKKGIPQRVSDAVMKALGLAVLYLGLSGAWDMEKPLVTIASLAIGTAVGTAVKLVDWVGALTQKLTGRLGKGEWKNGMVTATLLFCVGAMGITGALTDGLTGDHSLGRGGASFGRGAAGVSGAVHPAGCILLRFLCAGGRSHGGRGFPAAGAYCL